MEKRKNDPPVSEATIKIKVGGVSELSAGEGEGPVNALDNALRKVLLRFYPRIKDIHLADFKVRALDAAAGTAAKVRVLIQTRDGDDIWGTWESPRILLKPAGRRWLIVWTINF